MQNEQNFRGYTGVDEKTAFFWGRGGGSEGGVSGPPPRGPKNGQFGLKNGQIRAKFGPIRAKFGLNLGQLGLKNAQFRLNEG